MMCHFNLTTVLWVTVFICFGNLDINEAQWVIDDEGCRTPDGGTGSCIPVRECTPMTKVLESLRRPTPVEVVKKLQEYICAPDVRSYKVCCPPGPIILEQPQSQPVSTPPDISRHRNLYLLPKDCGILDEENRITHGEDAALNEFPWMALLQFRSRKGLGFNCGGTIINKNYILTAAHCITALTNSQLVSVRVGEYSIKNKTDCVRVKKNSNEIKCNPPIQDLRIEDIIPHQQFGPRSFANDIGLLRVSTMNLNVENVRPVCLPLKRNYPAYNNVIVTGWGVTDTNTGATSDILQKVGLPIADKVTCASTYANHNIRVTQTQVCAGGASNKDSCPGDSGGPMMVASIGDNYKSIYIQHGIVSFGPKYCGIPGYPGVYTLVNNYMNWILDNLRP